MMSKLKLSSIEVALVAIFAALSVVTSKVIPGIPIIGVPDANISLDASLAPVYGIIIGPYLGSLAALLGGLISATSVFDILTSFSTAISAFVAGFLVRKKISPNHNIGGWIIAAFTLISLIIGWYTTWVGQQAPLYPILHFLGLLIVLVFRGRIATYFEESNSSREKKWTAKPSFILLGISVLVSAYIISKPYWIQISWPEFLPYLSLPLYFLGSILIVYGLFAKGNRIKFVASIGLSTYCGIIADHMLGNLIFISVINVLIPFEAIQTYFLLPRGLPSIPDLFMFMIPVSAVERFLLTAIAMIIGIGLVLTLRKTNLLQKRQKEISGID